MADSSVVPVELRRYDATRLKKVVDSGGWQALERARERIAERLRGHTLWEINSTARGGGVAEMLAWFLPLLADGGVDVRWGVLDAPDELWTVTKRLHHMLHEADQPLQPGDRETYERCLEGAARQVRRHVRPGDVVVVDDPQPAGLIPALAQAGAVVVWRCHIGTDHPGPQARDAWDFLAPCIEPARAFVFSRRSFAWETLDADRIQVIQPAIDPLDAKNQPLAEETVRAIVGRVGLRSDHGAEPAFERSDGSRSRVERRAELVQVAPIPDDASFVAQVSRWDPLKDPIGVVAGFVEHVPEATGAHLVLAGPAPGAVEDDPEGRRVLDAVRERWRSLPERQRARVHLALLPMDDVEENAAMVNAIQRGAAVVVQKSLREGFGLTVAEAMWKERPVVAGAVGGIQDQIEDGRSGLLVDPADDLAAFGAAVTRLLEERSLRDRLGAAARERVAKRYLGDRMAADWAELMERVLAS
jgi:trehalose synthase